MDKRLVVREEDIFSLVMISYLDLIRLTWEIVLEKVTGKRFQSLTLGSSTYSKYLEMTRDIVVTPCTIF